MKRTLVWLIVGLLFVGLAHDSNAEMAGLDLGICASYLEGNDLSEAYGASARIKIELIEVFAVDARAGFLEFDDADTTVYPIELVGLLQIPIGPLNVYGGLGVGHYSFDAPGDKLDDSVGFFPVAGAELGSGSVRLFGEVRWMLLSVDADTASQELEGIVDGDDADVDSLGVNIGLNYHF